MLMKTLRLLHPSTSPLAREEELCHKLQAAGIWGTEPLRLTISGRWLFMDGFVESLDKKLKAERTCRELAPGSTVVNRLRVVAAAERQVL
jgi:hypothetical protein